MHTSYSKGTPLFIRLKSEIDLQGKFFDHKSGTVILEGGKRIKISQIEFISIRKLDSPALNL